MSIILEITFFFKKWYFILYFLPLLYIFLKYKGNNLIDHGWYNILGFMFFFICDFKFNNLFSYQKI